MKRTDENVPSFGTLELGSRTWGQINPAGTRGPNTFPYDNGPDSVTTPNAGPIAGDRTAEELQYYEPSAEMAILETSKRLQRTTDKAFEMMLENLSSEA